MIELSRSDDQEQLVEASRVFFAEECPPAVRPWGTTASGSSTSSWWPSGPVRRWPRCGTSEVQRDIIASRGLGLPRSRR